MLTPYSCWPPCAFDLALYLNISPVTIFLFLLMAHNGSSTFIFGGTSYFLMIFQCLNFRWVSTSFTIALINSSQSCFLMAWCMYTSLLMLMSLQLDLLLYCLLMCSSTLSCSLLSIHLWDLINWQHWLCMLAVLAKIILVIVAGSNSGVLMTLGIISLTLYCHSDRFQRNWQTSHEIVVKPSLF